MNEGEYAPYHVWGDDFDFGAVEDAGHYISTNCQKWARFGVHTKEKYGTLRVSTLYWSCWPVHSVVYPKHYFYQWSKKWIGWVEYPLAELFMFLRVTRLVNWYQDQVLKHFWLKAADKWPHVKEEILDEFRWYFPSETNK